MKQKEISLPIIKKELEQGSPAREVSFYIFVFDEPDLHGDIITRETKIEIYKHAKYFLNHDLEKLIGVIKEITTDNIGVIATVKLANTLIANDVYELYKEGAITQHSVGIYILEEGKTLDGYNEIKHLRLMEVSTLTHYAAQPLATTISVKNKNKNKIKDDIYMEKETTTKSSELYMKIKATQEEVTELSDKLQVVESKNEEVLTAIGNLRATVETLKDKYSTPQDETADTMEKSKNIGLTVKDVAISRTNKKISTKDLFKTKSVSYSGTGFRDKTPTFYNSLGYKRRLLDLLRKEFVKSSSIVWSGFSSHTPANNLGPGCYTPVQTNVTVRHENLQLNYAVAVTDFCTRTVDEIENQDEFFVKLAELLFGEVETTICNNIYNQFITFGTVQTATPTWTALAATITDNTLVDILHVHSVDIHNLSGGKINPLDCVLIVNPVDYSRVFTDKTPSNRDVATMQDIVNRVIPDLSVPVGQYVMIPNQYLTLYTKSEANVRIAPSAGLESFSGVEYIGVEVSFGLSLSALINNNVVIYGSIAAAIANY